MIFPRVSLRSIIRVLAEAKVEEGCGIDVYFLNLEV